MTRVPITVLSLSLLLAGCGSASAGTAASSGTQASTSASSTSVPATTSSPTASSSATASNSVSGSGSGSPVTSTRSASSSGPAVGTHVTVTVSGDLLWHTTLLTSARADHARTGKGDVFDFGPLFADIAPIIKGASMSICQEEVPVAKPGGPYTGYPVFAAPPQVATFIRAAGWDYCTTSSNHAMDDGFTGLVRTIKDFNAAGILTSGTYASASSAVHPPIYTTANGVKIAVVGATYALNGFKTPAGEDWAVTRLNAATMIAQAKAAKAAGADIVIAQMHAGNEYVAKPSAQQVQLANALTASPYIDLVYGQHVHIVQPWTTMNGKWVAYGLGNLAAQSPSNQPRTHEGVIGRFTFTKQTDGSWRVTKAEDIPTLVTNWSPGNPVRVYPVDAALAAGKGNAARLRVAQAATRATVNSLGAHPIES